MEKIKVKTDKMLAKLGQLNDEQFKVLFFIYNTINLKHDESNFGTKIYREVLADLTGKSVRTISRITDKLVEQGLIVKNCASDGTKLYNYYSIPRQKTSSNLVIDETETTQNLVTDDRVKEHNRTKQYIKEQNRTEKNTKEDIELVTQSTENTNDYFNDFKEKVDTKLVGNEDELLQKKVELSTELGKKRIAVGNTVYNRCSSYLRKKYEEKCVC